MKSNKLLIAIVIFFMLIVLALDLFILMVPRNYQISTKINSDINNSYNRNNVVINSPNLLNNNAIVTNIWIENTRLDKIKNNNIRYLMVDVGNTGDDGRLLTPKEDIDYFIKMIKDYEEKNNYSFVLLPYSEIDTNKYQLSPEFEDNFVKDYQDLSEDFDGVFVDIEPIQLNMREDYVSLLKRLRSSIPQGKIISVYSGSITESSENEWEWDIGFTKQVSDASDLIVVQGYDTSLSTKEDYQNYIKSQVKIISLNEFKSNFLIGVPTHKNYPETLDNALTAYTEEINKYPRTKLKGVSVFSEWTIGSDWKTFERFFGYLILTK